MLMERYCRLLNPDEFHFIHLLLNRLIAGACRYPLSDEAEIIP